MSPITKDQQTYCKMAQLYQALKSHPSIDQTAFERVLLRIDDVNLKVIGDKSKKCSIYNSQIRGTTLLHIAGFRKHLKAFDSILKRGADFTAKNSNGYTALHRVFYNEFPKSRESLETTSGFFENAFVNSVLTAHVKSGNSGNPCSADGLSHFHIACAANQLEAVQLFLNSGVSVDEAVNVDSSIFPGYTPLHFAARFCGHATAKLLLGRRANVQVKNVKGLTPLQVVIRENIKLTRSKRKKIGKDYDNCNKYIEENEEIIKLFLGNGMLDVDSRGFCNFHAVCTLSDSSLVESSVKVADVNCAINMDSPILPGYTALHFAVHFNVEAAKLLLKNGANIKAKDAKGITPLDFCMENYNAENLHNILSATVDFKDILFSDNKTKFMDCLHAMRSLSTFKDFLKTTLINIRLSENCLIWPGYCISHLVVHFSKHDYHREQEDSEVSVIEGYFSLDDIAMIQDAHGRTPLHLAFYQQKYKVVDMFFRYQLQDVIDNQGLSHLHIACVRANENIVWSLLSNRAKVNNQYRGQTLSSGVNSGSTPLHIAVARGDHRTTKLLLQFVADVNVTDAHGMTPIHYILSSYPRQPSILIGNLLFQSYNLKDIVSHKTALSHLHVASAIGNKRAVEDLIDIGANINEVVSCTYGSPKCGLSSCLSGCTPLYLAVKEKHTEIKELLLKAGAEIFGNKPSGIKLLYSVLSNFGQKLYLKYNDVNTTRMILSKLAKNMELQEQIKNHCGMTLLHIACYLRDVEQIKKLLIDSPSDVNAQLHPNSPIWPGASPLDVLITSAFNVTDLKDAVKPLLDGRADVTLRNNCGDTPLHRSVNAINYASETPLLRILAVPIQCYEEYTAYDLVRLLLKYQKDMSVNPVNEQGISHFHLACMVSEYTIVEQFLKNGVDVNLPIDYRNRTMTFQTPLHLVLQSRWDRQLNTKSQLRTIDVLLKYGADVNVQDENGLTPIHEAAWGGPSRYVFFQKLVQAGADVNYTNINGESTLEILVKSEELKKEEFSLFLGHFDHLNIFNRVDGRGILALLTCCPDNEHRRSILDTITQSPSFFSVDEYQRTPIHNIVASYKSIITSEECGNYIERFVRMGYDIDAKDSTGKTALHRAASFYNERAIAGLIIVGADINITDELNKTAFRIISEFRDERWMKSSQRRSKAEDARKKILSIFAVHVRKLQLCGLDVHFENRELADRELSESPIELHREAILKEVEDTKLVPIEVGTLTLRDLLSETGVVASRSSMTRDADRKTIDKLLEHTDFKRFPHVANLLKLQHGKTMKRLRMIETAADSLKNLVGIVNGFLMPDVCCCMIFRCLTNTELENLIKSVVE